MRRFLYLGGACLVLAVSYAAVVRPWLLSWGTTAAERAKPLPGDELVAANESATRAITIDVPPERVWPWVAQIGQGRGGFYSYTWLENLAGCEIENADRIHPEWQHLEAGDAVRVHPQAPPIPVLIVEPDRTLVLGGSGDRALHIPPMTWGFVLEPLPGGRTRLLVRERSRLSGSLRDVFMNKYLLEPAAFIMERRMLVGIRERAEKAGG